MAQALRRRRRCASVSWPAATPTARASAPLGTPVLVDEGALPHRQARQHGHAHRRPRPRAPGGHGQHGHALGRCRQRYGIAGRRSGSAGADRGYELLCALAARVPVEVCHRANNMSPFPRRCWVWVNPARGPVGAFGAVAVRKGQTVQSAQHRERLAEHQASCTAADALAWQRAYERAVHALLSQGVDLETVAKTPMPSEIRERAITWWGSSCMAAGWTCKRCCAESCTKVAAVIRCNAWQALLPGAGTAGPGYGRQPVLPVPGAGSPGAGLLPHARPLVCAVV